MFQNDNTPMAINNTEETYNFSTRDIYFAR